MGISLERPTNGVEIANLSPAEFQDLLQEFKTHLHQLETDPHNQLFHAAYVKSAIGTIEKEKLSQENYLVKLGGVHHEFNDFLLSKGYSPVDIKDKEPGREF